MDRRGFIKAGGAVAAGIAIGGVHRAGPAQAQVAPPRPVVLAGKVGRIDDDLDPRTSALADFGAGDAYQLDCRYRSIGVDLGRTQRFAAIELTTDTASHRLNTRDLSVFTSDDNKTWTRQDTEFLDLGTTVWLFGLDVEARYVKVHSHRGEGQADATFTASNLQSLATVHRIPYGSFVAGPGPWTYRTQLLVSNPGPDALQDRAAYLTLTELGAPALIAQGRLAADLSDLRFADPAGRQLHAYFDGQGVFIRIPHIDPRSDLPIFAYSGCRQAQSVLTDSGALQVEYGRRTYQFQGGKEAADPKVGYCEDPDPATGNLTGIGAHTLLGYDYRRRSVGLDYGEPTEIGGLALVDNDETTAGRPGSRMNVADFTIWVSDTNASDWRQVTNWTVQGGPSTFTFSGPPVTARYIKVNQRYADTAFTFVNYLDDILRPHPAPEPSVPFGHELHPVRLPDGTLLVAADTTAAGGIHARYSRDGGHTWSEPEPMIPPSDPAAGGDRAGGFLVDPDTGALTAVFYSVGVRTGSDWTDPTQHLCQVWAARATRYVDSKPVFDTPPHRIEIINHEMRKPASWALTYTNPIKTTTGAYVVAIAYIYRPTGEFAVAVLRSTDQGLTWQQSQTPLATPEVHGLESGPTEATVTQLANRDLVIFTRQQSVSKHYFGMSTSRDDGVTWSALTDSTILASNTVPCFLPAGDDLLLSWPGHNAFGQWSYRRNNLTIAYSTDGARTFHGYHDVTGATSLSTPGWVDNSEQRRMHEPFIVPAGEGDKDLLVAWAGGLRSGGGSTLLIEDIRDYLHNSHGALDVIHHIEPARHSSGTELAQSRWWNNSVSGTLELTDGAMPGRRAVRLISQAGSQAGASRLFPGTRRGRVRFKLRTDALGAELRLALQEGYADGQSRSAPANAHGTVALFAIKPTGEVLTTDDDVLPVVHAGGYLENDTNPATGSLTFGLTGTAAFDYNRRSVGLHLGADAGAVSGLVLTGSTQQTPSGVTRLQPSDLRVWISNDNVAYHEVTGWSGTKDGLVITLTGPEFTARYVKITQPYGDRAFTFANLMMSMTYTLPQPQQRFSPLQVPTALNLKTWYTMQVDFDLDADNVTTRIGNEVVSRLPVLHPASTLTHLLVLPGPEGVVDVSIDEVLAQDMSQGLPTIRRIGPPASVPGRSGH